MMINKNKRRVVTKTKEELVLVPKVSRTSVQDFPPYDSFITLVFSSVPYNSLVTRQQWFPSDIQLLLTFISRIMSWSWILSIWTVIVMKNSNLPIRGVPFQSKSTKNRIISIVYSTLFLWTLRYTRKHGLLRHQQMTWIKSLTMATSITRMTSKTMAFTFTRSASVTTKNLVSKTIAYPNMFRLILAAKGRSKSLPEEPAKDDNKKNDIENNQPTTNNDIKNLPKTLGFGKTVNPKKASTTKAKTISALYKRNSDQSMARSNITPDQRSSPPSLPPPISNMEEAKTTPTKGQVDKKTWINNNNKNDNDSKIRNTSTKSKHANRKQGVGSGGRSMQPNVSSSSSNHSTSSLRENRNKRRISDSTTTTTTSTTSTARGPIIPGRPKPSLLPPPLSSYNVTKEEDDLLISGLSSWEEFLGQSNNLLSTSREKSSKNKNESKRDNHDNVEDNKNKKQGNDKGISSRLPNISDLFPPTSPYPKSSSSGIPSRNTPSGETDSDSLPNILQGMDGVLPVSELFYRSSQSILTSQDTTRRSPDKTRDNRNNNNDDDDDDDDGGADDEELPFSAEQSDSLVSEDGGVQIRHNQADTSTTTTTMATTMSSSSRRSLSSGSSSSSSASRKMVRRGMEMLVGGVPIHVDPPQRSVELTYQVDTEDWAKVIAMNTRDFGPLLHLASIPEVTDVERGLYCESFVHSSIKWDICPQDLRDIVQNHHVEKSSYATLLDETLHLWNTNSPSRSTDTVVSKTLFSIDRREDTDEFLSSQDFDFHFIIGGISQEELESISDPVSLERLVVKTIVTLLKDNLLVEDFSIQMNRLVLKGMKENGERDSAVEIAVNFRLEAEGEEGGVLSISQSINPTLTQAIHDGSFGEALVEAAAEQGWFDEIIDEIIQDWSFVSGDDDDDDDENAQNDANPKTPKKKAPRTVNPTDSTIASNLDKEGPFGYDSEEETDDNFVSDIFLAGGNDGVFFDYSESNRENAPFQGTLGPLLLDATIERAKQRLPRVIAIGDVHGCIDELQDLLRLCDYRPGDLVCFLGDLVCKGPDSISVVKMAREIGAIGIRGNHDFEVVRWYQAIQSGVDPPVVGSEHFHIASCLSKADMKWLYSLPWYISSKDLGALFVHAGFVAGIRLAKQNPRLMMNMRSILPDGTVTSKFFSNWPWARLWDGPQTVLFGHDADRGLQQYEHAIGLDTGCVYGGRLTACILPEKRLVSVSARREYFKYRRRHYD